MKRLIYLLALIMSLSSFGQIDKIEPPFWWSDMHLEELQIMLYGKNIGEYEVSAKAPLIITNVRQTENPNYLFFSINSGDLDPGKYTLSFSKDGEESFQHTYELRQREENSALREGFDASDVIYLIMPDRFANGNPENDS
ncbi:MAG: cyclomaltodextrinase N-terminal domain-containing protein, partial [Christiangramia sp.]|nr:cyclomaltodextrinase N-terminal domain-containing protein [Christiangramia sp.]